jgi:xanthine dehydrogenase FAD-binding subunit
MFDFESYQKADSIEDAIQLLTENPESHLIAGGTDILVRLREGQKQYANLVDIHGLASMGQIGREKDGTITIGSGASFSQVAESKVVLDHIPVLAKGAASVGGPQVRNIATIGGNICNGAPSADSAAPLLVLNAKVDLQGPEGKRCLPLAKFYLGPGRVDLKKGEIMTGLRVAPEDYQGFEGHYIKYAMRNAMDIATIGCAASLKLSKGKISNFRLAYTVAGPTPLRCPKTEKKLAGMTVNEDMFATLKQDILGELSPRDSWRAGKAFREHIILALAEKIVRELTGLKGDK